jgi:hypothetical protein
MFVCKGVLSLKLFSGAWRREIEFRGISSVVNESESERERERYEVEEFNVRIPTVEFFELRTG